MNRSRTLLIRALSNELNPEEQREFEVLLEHDQSLRKEYSRMIRLETLVSVTAHDSFSAGFADRLIDSLSAGTSLPKESLFDMLISGFYRLASVAVVVIVILGAYNITRESGYGTDQSPIEAALGLQPVSIEDAYAQALQQQGLYVVLEDEE